MEKTSDKKRAGGLPKELAPEVREALTKACRSEAEARGRAGEAEEREREAERREAAEKEAKTIALAFILTSGQWAAYKAFKAAAERGQFNALSLSRATIGLDACKHLPRLRELGLCEDLAWLED